MFSTNVKFIEKKMVSKQLVSTLLFDLINEDDDDLSSQTAILNSYNITLSCIRLMKNRVRIPRVLNYADCVVSSYSPEVFRKRFRINPTTFNRLVEELRGYTRDFRSITLEKQVLIFIKYISSQMTLQAIADIFGVCEFSVFEIVRDLSDVICQKLLPKYITWPSRNQIPRTVQKFKEKKGFPGVLGAIDGTHIPIRAPREFHENYINRKSFHSINLQGICDSNMHFLDVFCGWPGSVHDSRVFKNSPIHGIIENNTEEMFPGNTHLLGDSAYGLTTWLMTPFKDYGNLNSNQKRYNFVHSSTRMMIEHAFGALKGRFRRLKYIDMLDLNKAVKVSLSCCVLHELCVLQNDDMNEYIEEGVREMEEINNFFEVHNPSDTAESKRRIIVDNLSI
ncbi:putative nuclease HARBI1 [Mytilus edulis]|uniref:putative nuclease HARBI1 n=1 Tax=Mytilus edulis TaxID=6550 RepID=UPI0039EFFA76